MNNVRKMPRIGLAELGTGYSQRVIKRPDTISSTSSEISISNNEAENMM